MMRAMLMLYATLLRFLFASAIFAAMLLMFRDCRFSLRRYHIPQLAMPCHRRLYILRHATLMLPRHAAAR